jgi:hypothetical protein
VAALVVEALAPATATRIEGKAPGVVEAAMLAITGPEGLRWLFTWYFRSFAPTVVLCIGMPWVLSRILPVGSMRLPSWVSRPTSVAIALGFTFALVWASFVPANWAYSSDPPLRAHIVPVFFLVCFSVYLGLALLPLFDWIFNALFSRMSGWAPAVATLALALVPLVAGAATVPEARAAQAAAARWDAVDRTLRTARAEGNLNPVIEPQPRFLGLPYVGRDREDWFNVCVARLYGLETIAATGDPL